MESVSEQPKGFIAYSYYIGLKLHFTNEKYDILQYRGKAKISRSAFEKRKDKKFFEYLEKRCKDQKTLLQYLIANFAYQTQGNIWDRSSADDAYREWVKRKEAITQTFRNDLSYIRDRMEQDKHTLDDIMKVSDALDHPLLLSYYLGSFITIETLVILNQLFGIMKEWDSLILLWHDTFLKIERLTPFVKFDRMKAQSAFNDLLT